MSEKKYMIVLSGQGDTQITLANPEAEGWIDSSYTGTAYEKIPDAVMAGYEKDGHEAEVLVTSGSGDNDRALATPGKTFYDMRSAMAYIRANNIEITGEYHGYIY